jgi:hypothetical protein
MVPKEVDCASGPGIITVQLKAKGYGMNERIRRLVGQFGLWILLMVVIGVGGCGADKKGKFTDEQMAQFPLATRYNLPGPSGWR